MAKLPRDRTRTSPRLRLRTAKSTRVWPSVKQQEGVSVSDSDRHSPKDPNNPNKPHLVSPFTDGDGSRVFTESSSLFLPSSASPISWQMMKRSADFKAAMTNPHSSKSFSRHCVCFCFSPSSPSQNPSIHPDPTATKYSIPVVGADTDNTTGSMDPNMGENCTSLAAAASTSNQPSTSSQSPLFTAATTRHRQWPNMTTSKSASHTSSGRPTDAAAASLNTNWVLYMGVVASKKVGNAVARNRCKRLIREAWRKLVGAKLLSLHPVHRREQMRSHSQTQPTSATTPSTSTAAPTSIMMAAPCVGHHQPAPGSYPVGPHTHSTATSPNAASATKYTPTTIATYVVIVARKSMSKVKMEDVLQDLQFCLARIGIAPHSSHRGDGGDKQQQRRRPRPAR